MASIEELSLSDKEDSAPALVDGGDAGLNQVQVSRPFPLSLPPPQAAILLSPSSLT